MGIETAWAPKPVRHGSSSAAERECGAIAGVDVAKTGEGRKHAGDGGLDLAALPERRGDGAGIQRLAGLHDQPRGESRRRQPTLARESVGIFVGINFFD